METDIRVMLNLLDQIERGKVNFKKSPKDRLTEGYMLARLEGLEVLIGKFTEKHEKIISTYDEDTLSASTYITEDIFGQGYEMYLEYKGELLSKLKVRALSFQSEKTDLGQTLGTSSASTSKLPKIAVPTFNGDYEEWITFHDLFLSLIHNNSALDDVQRLHYLKTLVTGEAQRLIKHVSITAANYKKCWDILNARYNNKRYLVNNILKRLFNQRNLKLESASGLMDLLDTTTECLHELSCLDINISSWDVLIIYLVSSKLDAVTRKEWELEVNRSGDDLPTYKSFTEFMKTRFKALEAVEPQKCKSKLHPSRFATNHAIEPGQQQKTNNLVCPHCADSHRLYNCKDFSKQDVSKRREIVRTLSLCFNCLGTNHAGRQCRVVTKCRVCQKRHHTLLHPQNMNVVATATAVDTISDEEEINHSEDEDQDDFSREIKAHLSTGNVHGQTLLATALLKAESKNGCKQILRALLDQGSQASFISEAAVQLLRLPKVASKGYIVGIGGGKGDLTSKSIVMVNIQSLHDPTFQLQVKAHVLSTVTSVLPNQRFSMQPWSELNSLDLADPQYNIPNKIDILLGAEVYCNILKDGLKKNPVSSMIAQNTYFGWILSGQIKNNEESARLVSMHVQIQELDILKRFWEIESEPNLSNKILTPEEHECEDHFNRTVRRDEDGRYIVELPFRSGNPNWQYGNSRNIAVKRLLSLEKRLDNSAVKKQQYSQVLNEYLELNHMEQVPEIEVKKPNGCVWLPHHAVIRMDKTTSKTRVVFNASSKDTNGVSLNDTLMVGPTLQPDLRHTVMRWRLHSICLTADIIKMYRQIKVAPKHVDFQRIVWRNDSKSQIKDYRLLRVTFGTSAAPYLAVKALQQTALDDGHAYPLAAGRVASDFYMDDLMTGCDSETEAVKIYEEMNDLLGRAGFTLQKWSSNKTELLKKLKIDTDNNLEIKEDAITKILGLTWNRCSDHFDYSVKPSPPSSQHAVSETKRQIIAEISRLYDPLGWIAPCIITAKVFIQKLWIAGLDWDDHLPEHLRLEWRSYREELSQLINFHIPRWLGRGPDDAKVELHGFSDASNTAYAAVVYMRVEKADGSIYTNLVTAKTKVAPIKQITIPRLELCGAALVAKLLKEVSDVLQVNSTDLHGWTDSTVVLAWLSDHPSRWKTFIANRTSQILNTIESTHWSYVQSRDNPADGASRGLTPSELLKSKLWLEGPGWLKNPIIDYKRPSAICTRTELEAKKIQVNVVGYSNRTSQTFPWDKYSTLRRLVRVVAYCRRFLVIKHCRQTGSTLTPYLSAGEIRDALKCCIRYFQSLFEDREFYPKLNLKILNPYRDSDGLLRVGGRLDNSFLSEDSKHPILVPEKSILAKLIVKDAHERSMHGGQQLTINYIRSKYWIPKVKTLVRSIIHECIPCIRHAALTKTQLMGQLPMCRVTPNKPFLCSGVDYAGPINIRVSKGRGNKSYKGYICLFVCMSTRAIHLEAVSDLTTEGFLAAFKRFVARRGRCNQIWSDNGTNFVGASRELKRLFIDEGHTMLKEIASTLASNGTEWHFIPPHAPNFGGLWEAGIKSTKHHLKRVIGDSTLTFEEMSTVLAQVEACLNSRPLSQVSTNADDPIPLTPGHFLVGEPLLIAPDGAYDTTPVGHLRRWQLTQRMVQCFWKKWVQEYLANFFQRYKWNTRIPEPKVGQVVLVREDNLPPAKWLYGRVVDIHPGRDNITRVVTLRCKDTTIKRPTSKLCVLPICDV